MIALDCQPISLVEDIDFQRLMNKVKPNEYFAFTKIFI